MNVTMAELTEHNEVSYTVLLCLISFWIYFSLHISIRSTNEKNEYFV